MFRPRDSYDQQLLEAKIEISPEPADLRWVHDVFGNCVAIASFSRRPREPSLVATISLNHSPAHGLEFTMDDHARTYPFSYDAEEMPDLLRSMERQYLDPGREVDRWARQFVHKDPTTRTCEML